MIFDGKRIVIKFPQIRAAVPSFSRRLSYMNHSDRHDGHQDVLKAQFHRDLHDVMTRDPKIGAQTRQIAARNSKAVKIKAALRSIRERDVA